MSVTEMGLVTRGYTPVDVSWATPAFKTPNNDRIIMWDTMPLNVISLLTHGFHLRNGRPYHLHRLRDVKR